MLSVMMNHRQLAKQNKRGWHVKNVILIDLIADRSKPRQKRKHDA